MAAPWGLEPLMNRRIYTDTSAIGGCLDDEFKTPSIELFARFRAGLDTLVVSELTLTSLEVHRSKFSRFWTKSRRRMWKK